MDELLPGHDRAKLRSSLCAIVTVLASREPDPTVSVFRGDGVYSTSFVAAADVLRFWNRDGKGLSNVYNALWRLLAPRDTSMDRELRAHFASGLMV